MMRVHKFVVFGMAWLAPWSGCSSFNSVSKSPEAAALKFAAQPSSTPVSAAIHPAVVVQAVDAHGRAVQGLAVSMVIGTNAADGAGILPNPRGVLSGTLDQITDAQGNASFPDLNIDWLGRGYTLVASVTGAMQPVTATSAPFDETRVGDACLGPAPACSSGCADSDGDGLNDAWEIAGGIDYNGDDKIDAEHDLLLPGADPNKPDIYVQYDWMDYGPMETACNVESDCTIMSGLSGFGCSGPALTEGYRASCVASCSKDSDCTSLGATHATDRCGLADGVQQCLHSHDPALIVPDGRGGSKALDAVVEAFAAHGLNLHIMRGNAQPHSHILSLHLLNDPVSPSNSISNSCEGGSLASGTAGPGLYAESFYDLKANSADRRQLPAYHYAIFGHDLGCDTLEHCNLCPVPLSPDGTPKATQPIFPGVSGVSEVYGNDFIVTLAAAINEVGNPPNVFNVGGTFMHELGHNLGLRHGGGNEDFPNYKPNFLSVMNYNYQFVGIPAADQVGSSVPNPLLTRLDYSTQVLPTGTATPGLLDENGKLDEAAGLGSGSSDLFFFTDATCNFQQGPTQGPVDWDGDGIAGDHSAVTADLNPADDFSHPCGYTTNEQFYGHVDWPPNAPPRSFTYGFQCTSPGSEDGAPARSHASPSRYFVGGELTAGMARAAHVLYPIRPVQIVIQPGCGSTERAIAPGQRGTIQVALLGAENLDVRQVDPASLHFHGAVPLGTSIRDVNGDKIPDLMLEFRASDVHLLPGAAHARITGWMNNSQAFVGETAVKDLRDLTSSSEACNPGGKP